MRQVLGNPSAEPVTAAELRLHARLDDLGETAELERFITAARTFIEAHTGRLIGARTCTLYLDAWPAMGDRSYYLIDLRPGPVTAASLVVDGNSYANVALQGDALAVSSSAPQPLAALGEGIVVTYTAGATATPAQKLAVLELAAAFYEAREGEAAVPPAVADHINRERVIRL